MKKIVLVFLTIIVLGVAASAQTQKESAAQQQATQQQAVAIKKQESAIQQQKEALAKQEALIKEQQDVMDALKTELGKDGLIRNDGTTEVLIRNSEMQINGVKQPADVHQKYMQLLHDKRKRAFGEKEEWRMKL